VSREAEIVRARERLAVMMMMMRMQAMTVGMMRLMHSCPGIVLCLITSYALPM